MNDNGKPTPAPRQPAPAEARFRALFERAPFSVQLLAADGRTLQVNKAWEDLWQVTEGDGMKEYVLNEYNMLQDPQLAAKGVMAVLVRAFQGESVTLPTVLYDPAEIGKAGRARWVSAFAHPVADESGKVVEVILVHEDVTDRIRAENALRTSELRLKQLANTIPQLAWMAEPDGAIHWYNDRWYEYTGTTPEQMTGWGWQRVHHPDVLPSVLERWKRSLTAGEPFQMTFPLRGSDGRYRPFFTLVAPLKDAAGTVVQWFGTNTDVSALHEAQDELRRTEERLRLATDAGGIGIWDWDIANNHVAWSERVYELHGLSPGGFGGRAEDFAALVHPDDRGRVWGLIEGALREGVGFSADFRIGLPDGTPRWLSTWARVNRGRDGRPERMVGATISIDEHKKAEAVLQESDKRKDEFLAMLAHELRNPLAPITTAAHLLAMPGGDEQRTRQASQVIARQVTHMTELVDDLLDVSRVTRGLVELNREVLDLKAVAASAIEQVRPLVESRQHVLTTWMAAEPVLVEGDRTRLIQVVVNLLNNAAKYTPPRGEIALRLDVRDAEAHLTVRDNGLGIEPALLPRVFELFTQAARTPDRAQGGLGIGLALVRSIAQLHDGSVAARSEGSGKGSEFELTLPLAVSGAVENPALQTRIQSRGGPVRIMVVDDNLDAAQTLAMLLESVGHQVEVEDDPRRVLERAETCGAQVFILDIGLPHMDGHELAMRLRRLPATAPATLIALTGYGQDRDRAASRAAGFDYHFVKPVDLEELAAALAAVR
ncbi:MAG TPA: PAS domain-containing protein [Usitatibacter sp.]|nr:PAS domain-containing protein [Usitatibacter sp.]